MEDAAAQMDGEPVCLDARASIASRVAKMSLPSIIDHRSPFIQQPLFVVEKLLARLSGELSMFGPSTMT
jgi:hypothetical protein